MQLLLVVSEHFFTKSIGHFLVQMAETINLNLNIWNKKTNLFLDNVRGKRPLCSGTNSISGGTFSEKAFLAGTQYFRNEKKKLEIINIKWQLDYILSWGQNDTKKTYHMACTRNKQWATNAKLFYFQLFHHYIHTVWQYRLPSFQADIQNWKDFCIKINIPKGNCFYFRFKYKQIWGEKIGKKTKKF